MPDSTQRTQLLHAASFVPIGAFAGKPAMPLTRPVLVIGSGPHARFLLKSDTVSTSHTLLIHTAGGWYLRDLVSRTHTILNGKSVREAPIRNGDTLTIGKFVFHCAIDGPPAEFSPVAPAALEITDAEIPVPIDTRTVLIGRRVGCEVRLIEESVSLVHAVLFEADGKHYVRDLYSRTGTFLNGAKVHEAPLAFGDVIVVGETTIRYIADATAGELSTAVATDVTADGPTDLVELEPFGVNEPARVANRTDELLAGSLGGSPGASLDASLGGTSAGSLAGAPMAATPIDPASLVPIADVPPASSVASAAGVALSEIPPAYDEIERPAESARSALPVSPVSPPVDESPLTIDLADEPANVSLERVRAAEPLEVLDVAEDDLTDHIVLPLNSRDVIDGPSDEPIEPEQAPESVPAEAARAADLPPIEALVAGDSPLPPTGTEGTGPASQREAVQVDLSDAEQEDIEADVLGLAPAAEHRAEHPAEHPAEEQPPAPISIDTIDLHTIEHGPEASAAPVQAAPEPFAAEPPSPPAPQVTPVLPLVAAPAAEEPKRTEPIFASAIHEEPRPEPHADTPTDAHDASHDSHESHAHEPALLLESHEVHDDHHAPIEPPGIEAAAVPQSAEARELAALQARIRQALEDPSTMARQPLLPETPDAPAPKLSEAARRARTIAELLESNEEYEEAAERESEAIALPVAEADIPAPAIETDESIAASDAAERSMAAGYEVPAAAALPPLEPIVEPPPPAIDIDDAIASDSAAAEPATNVVEAAGPAALAELIREADAGTPTATRDVAVDAGELSLAAGESAVIGDEEELVSASPAVDDLATKTTVAATEPRSDANDDALAIESAAGTVTAAPQASDAITPPEASLSQSAESPISEAASDEIVEVPAPAPKGRRGRKLPAAPSEPPAPKVRKATPARKPPRGKKGAEVAPVAAETAAPTPAIDPNLAAAAALVASEAQTAIDPAAAALASSVEAATESGLAQPVADSIGGRQSPAAEPATAVPGEASQSDALQAAGEVSDNLAAVQSRSDDLDTFADRVADAGREALEPESQSKADPEASFVEHAEANEVATSIGSGDDHTAGIALDASDVIESTRTDFASESPITRDTVDASNQSPTIEIETDRADVVSLEASVRASDDAGTASLDEIADAVQPDTLPVDEVIMPSRLAAEPDELQTVIDDERAPVEADAVNAGEAIMTSPVVIDEVEVELVAPMFDPDPGTIAEREALDTKSETTATIDDELGGEHVVVVDEEENDEVAAIDAVAPRPLRGEDAELIADAELDEEASVDLAFTDHSAAVDAVAPALEVGNAAELAGDSIQDTAGLDIEAIAEQGIESAAESSVAFVSLEAASTAEALPEALVISGESDAAFDEDVAKATVEGAWLARGDATVAEALADVVSDTVADSPDAIVERLSENESDTSALELVGPADVAEAAELLVVEPAPLAGSTLSTGQTLLLDLEASAEGEQADDRPDVLGRIGPATIDRDETPPADEELAPAASDEPADAPKPVPSRSVMVRGNPPPSTSVVNVNVPSMEELETTFQDAFAEALAMAEGAESKRPAPAPKPPATSTRPPAPKWELDESLLEQAEANAAAAAARKAAQQGASPSSPAAAARPAPTSAAFMSLGGIGWIGDESADEFEQVPASLRAPLAPQGPGGMRPILGGGVGQIGGTTSAQRTSRRRRPVPNELEAAVEAAAAAASAVATPVSEAKTVETPSSPSTNVESSVSDLPDELSPSEVGGLPIAIDELSDLDELLEPTAESLSPAFADEAPEADESAVGRKNQSTLAELDLPPVPAAESSSAPSVQPMVLPPRPVRRPRARADVDDSLASAASASPFAEQALPLVDAFSQNGAAPPALDDVLAKFGGSEGRIKGHPPITQDRPSHTGADSNAPTPSPFASQAPIDVPVDEVDDGSPLPIGHSSVRRTRQTINKLPLLLSLMIGLMAVAALAAWYVPVPVTVRGELTFINLDKQNSLDRAAIQEVILKQKLPKLDAPARQALDDRFSNGFLDRPELYAHVIEKARFEPSVPNLLVIDYVSNINQVEGDLARMNALMKQLVHASQDMVDAQHKLQDAAQALERSLARDAERRKVLNSEIDHVTAIAQSGPEVRDLKKAENDTNQAEQARKATAEALDACEAELKRLESNPLAFVPASLIEEEVTPLLAMFADVSDTAVVPTTRPADAQAELTRLTLQLQTTKARLDQLEAAQSPESKAARDGFDAALEAFAGDVENARKVMDGRPELLQYIDSARKLQEQIRTMTETMVRRQQQNLTRLHELKQQLADKNSMVRDQRLTGDEELRKWNDQIAINERRLNGARSDGASANEIGTIESELSLLKSMVSAKEETLKDPSEASVDKKLGEIISATQREMEADRTDNEQILTQMQEAFTRQQPAVEGLPQEQKQLGEALAGRLAQIDLARQRYTQSLGRVVGGEAMQVTELRQKVQDLEAAIAKVKPVAEADAVAQAGDMERRAAAAKLLVDARAKVVAARAARDAATIAYESKAKSLASLVERRDAASAARQRADAIKAEDETIKARMSNAIADKQTTEVRLQNAVVPDATRGPGVRTIDAPRGDPRLMYGAGGLVMIGLVFTPLLLRETRSRPMSHRVRDDDHRPVVPGNAHAA
jgi:pSer/pThr/pTyr-binding forkhead associated (FHA) protein